MSLGTKMVVQIYHSFKNKRGVHCHLQVLLYLEIKLSIMDRICRNLELDECCLKEAWHKEVLRLLHVIDMVGTPYWNAMMDGQFALSVFKQVTSWNSALRTWRVVQIWATEPNLHQLLHNTRQHLEEPLLVLAEGQPTSMKSLPTKSNRTVHML